MSNNFVRILSMPTLQGGTRDFPMDRHKVRVALDNVKQVDSCILIFNADGREIYRIYSDARDFGSALCNVGKFLQDASLDYVV